MTSAATTKDKSHRLDMVVIAALMLSGFFGLSPLAIIPGGLALMGLSMARTPQHITKANELWRKGSWRAIPYVWGLNLASALGFAFVSFAGGVIIGRLFTPA